MAKYFLKEICQNHGCVYCYCMHYNKSKGYLRGADVTELIERLDKKINIWMIIETDDLIEVVEDEN